MPMFECSKDVTTTLTGNILAETREQACAAFKAVHGQFPDRVGDSRFLLACWDCGRPLFDGDDFRLHRGGSTVCMKCVPVGAEDEDGLD